MKEKKYILVTGAAGFIGYHTCKRLIKENKNIIGIDNINSYYDVNLKKSRLENLKEFSRSYLANWTFIKCELENEIQIKKIFEDYKPEIVIHLAAQAGVRYSLTNPQSYIKSNILGFYNIIEACKNFKVKNFLYASSSSVYGANKKIPFSEVDSVDHPVSLYAATKKSNEIIAHSYSHLYGIPATGMRFFTVYGPFGRPDMAPMIFANAIMDDKPIKIYNFGKMKRDFTFIDDIVECIFRCTKKAATFDKNNEAYYPNPSSSDAPHRIFNFGNSNAIDLLDFVEELENVLNKKAIKEFLPIQMGDVKHTEADITLLKEWINFAPRTSLKEGIKFFVKWFISYKKIY